MLNSSEIVEIEPGVFLGSIFATDPLILQANSIDHIFHFGFELSSKLPKQITSTYFDLEDNESRKDDIVRIGLEICTQINKLLVAGKRVLVCCQAGRSRSASVILLWLHGQYPYAKFEELME
jgi:hypothetical protein